MCDEWMPVLRLPLTREQFHQLPRTGAYKYELLNGQVYLTPRPRHYHAVLDLRLQQQSAEVCLRHVEEADWEALVPVFAWTFQRTQPFGSLDDASRLEAARQSLERTRTGGDGPWIERASFVALSEDRQRLIGAILITLLPKGDPCDEDSYYWTEPPPADCIERRLGQPHLTWIFVTPLEAGYGVGTALLAAAERELLGLGYPQLASTFMTGNDSSMLWHWRCGFRLLAYPSSKRALRERWRQRQQF
jgi:GNAT superfamily N-acetyltransferase